LVRKTKDGGKSWEKVIVVGGRKGKSEKGKDKMVHWKGSIHSKKQEDLANGKEKNFHKLTKGGKKSQRVKGAKVRDS